MQIKLLILGILLVFSSEIIAQDDTPKGMNKGNKSSIRFEANLTFNEQSESEITVKINDCDFDKKCIILNPKIALKSADLIIEFELKSVDAGIVKVRIDSIFNQDLGILFPIHSNSFYKDTTLLVNAEENSTIRLVIANTVDNINPKLLSGNVMVRLIAQEYSYKEHIGKKFGVKVCCPDTIYRLQTFRLKRGRILSLIGTGVTGYSFWNSNRLFDKSRDIYSKYKEKRTKDDAEDAYEEANDLSTRSINYKNIAIGTGIATTLWIVLQELIQKERIRIYTDECDPKFKIKRRSKKSKKSALKRNVDLIFPGKGGFGVQVKFNF